MGDFVSLHHHSTYSYLDGYATPEEHIIAAANLEMPAMALTEHGNISSHVKLEQAANKHGIKPLFGIEAYTGKVDEDRSRWKWHLTILAMNQEGYRNLLRITSKGWAEGFFYEPTISGEMLAEHNEGLIVLSGCSGSKMACDLLGGKGVPPHEVDYGSAIATANKFRDLFGDRYYLETQAFPELERTRSINQAWERVSEETGIPIVATGDVHYPRPKDGEMQVILHAIDRGGRNNTVEKQLQSWGYDIKLTNFRDEIVLQKLIATGLSSLAAEQAIANTGLIADRCNVTLPKLKELQFPSKTPNEELFRQWLRKGWNYRGFDNLIGEERGRYLRRLKHEISLIVEKGFIDYFLVISDVVRFAKREGIPVGPARGSAAGSLACFLLRITEVNPMLFSNLLFERFIDKNRHDIPDIDLDFDDEQRWKIRQYLCDQYGEDRVGNIGTFVKYKGRNSLIDVARVHKVPVWALEGVKEKLIERSSGDLRANATIEDTIEMFPDVKKIFEQFPELYLAKRLEGNLRGFSVHAAGLVVANEPLTNSVAVYTRIDSKTGNRGEVLSIDKYDAEYLNALKIDFLGLKTMGVIRRCLELTGMSLEELYKLPLDDPEVYAGFKRNEVIGIFQFDGRAMRSVNREVKPDNFSELADINALSRPGPLHSGAAAEYIMVKHRKKEQEDLGEVVARITEDSNGQIVYQESILQVVRELGGFSWEEAARIRKLISKKQGEQAFQQMRMKFIKGAIGNDLEERIADKVWKQLVTAGAYAFNRAHSISYSIIAYWTMWIKQHFPLQFYCASLQKYDPKTKGFDLLKEAKKKEIPVLPPHPIRSEITWSINKELGGLQAGITQIPGIGEKIATAMIDYREAGISEIKEWKDYLPVRGIGPKTIESLEEFSTTEDPFGLDLLTKTLEKVRAWLWENGDAEGLPFPTSTAEDIPYSDIAGQHVWLGTVREINLKDVIELHRSRTGEELNPATIKQPEYLNYAVLTCEDQTGPLVITVHRWNGLYEKYKKEIWNIKKDRDLILVNGYKRKEFRRAIYANNIWIINTGEI